MEIGRKIKDLRIRAGLTQEELADRSELTKGFISQLERDKTSPSVSTFLDILEALGTNPVEFFKDDTRNIIFKPEDYFEYVNDELGYSLNWIVPDAQKNNMEPTIIEISPKGESKKIPPFEGEVLGHIVTGRVVLHFGDDIYKLKKNETFYFHANREHFLENRGSSVAKVIWISSPPHF